MSFDSFRLNSFNLLKFSEETTTDRCCFLFSGLIFLRAIIFIVYYKYAEKISLIIDYTGQSQEVNKEICNLIYTKEDYEKASELIIGILNNENEFVKAA